MHAAPHLTHKAQSVDLVLEHKTGQGLVELVTELRGQRLSWPQISGRLWQATGMSVNPQQLRVWAGQWGVD